MKSWSTNTCLPSSCSGWLVDRALTSCELSLCSRDTADCNCATAPCSWTLTVISSPNLCALSTTSPASCWTHVNLVSDDVSWMRVTTHRLSGSSIPFILPLFSYSKAKTSTELMAFAAVGLLSRYCVIKYAQSVNCPAAVFDINYWLYVLQWCKMVFEMNRQQER